MRWRRLAARLIVIAAIAAAAALVPLPERLPKPVRDLAMPAVVVVVICGLGKALYDTLFYDRYRP